MSLSQSTLNMSYGEFPDVDETGMSTIDDTDSSGEKSLKIESYETVAFIPCSSDVMDLVNDYKHLIKKLDHYPRGEEKSELLLTLFAEIGELIAWGFNDMNSMNAYEERKEAVDKYLKTPPARCTSTCTLV